MLSRHPKVSCSLNLLLSQFAVILAPGFSIHLSNLLRFCLSNKLLASKFTLCISKKSHSTCACFHPLQLTHFPSLFSRMAKMSERKCILTASGHSFQQLNSTTSLSPTGCSYPKRYLEVPSSVTNLTIDRLLPLREYFVEVESWSLDRKLSNTSRQILFTSPSNDSTFNYPYYIPSLPLPPSPNSGITTGNMSSAPNPLFLPHPSSYYPLYPPPRGGKYRPSRMKSIYYHPSFHGQDGDIELPFIKLDEAIIVIFVLCFWMGVIGLFCNKWGKIRHLEPYHPDYHKRESTDTEIVDPFSSFSERQQVPGASAIAATVPGQPGSTGAAKLSSRMNTLTNNNVNSASISNFASIDLSGNPHVIGTGGEAIVINPIIGGSLGESSTLRPLNASVRKASLSLNEVSNLGKDVDLFNNKHNKQHQQQFTSNEASVFDRNSCFSNKLNTLNYTSFTPRLMSHYSSTGMSSFLYHQPTNN